MSEERAAETPTGDLPPAPGGTPPPTREAGGRRRIALILIGAVVTIGGALLIARSQQGTADLRPPATGSAAIGAIRAPQPPTAPGDPVRGVRIGGTVVDGAGGPVTGAEVSAELEAGAPDAALAGSPARGAGSAGADGTAVVHLGVATTADGRFAVDVPTSGRYRLRVTGPGLLPAEVRYVPVPSDEVRIVIARQVRIDGIVLDGTTPVPNAYVGLRGEVIGGTIERRTDVRGAFDFADLPEGRYQLFAWRGAVAARAIRVNRLGSGPFPPAELRLEAAAIVVGRVVDRGDGAGIVAAVELRPVGDDHAPRYARSGDDGVFRIEGIPHGDWIVDAFAPGYTSPGGLPIEAARGIPEIALVRGGTVEGTVRDNTGRPLDGATVRAVVLGPGSLELSRAIEQDQLRRFSGRMSAPAPITGALTADPLFIPRGELGVTVGPIPPIPPPGSVVARPASIDPTVASLAGEPEPLAIDPARASQWTTGRDGRYRIRGLPKGKVVVLAVSPVLAEGRSKTVAIEAGQAVPDVDVVLTPGTMLVGKVTDQHGVPVGAAQVSVKPELGAQLDVFSDADGSYRLGPVAGPVVLAASAFGHGDARRTIELAPAMGVHAAERREDLVVVVADAILAGTVDDATGATVKGATVEVVGGAADRRRVVVGDDGTFSIDRVPAGPHRVRVTHPDYPAAELDAAASVAGKERVRLRLPLGGAVEGALLDGDSGGPLAGLPVLGDGPALARAESVTDKLGRWKLGPIVPGRWRVIVKQPGYLPLTRDIEVPVSQAPGASSVRDIRLDLARGALLGGTVRDARGQRVASARVSVQLASRRGPIAEGTSDTRGEFRIRDCPTGDIAITATRGDDRGEARATIRPGDEVLGLAIELGRGE